MQGVRFVKGKPQHKSTSSEEVENLKRQIEELERSKIFHMMFILILTVSLIGISIWKQK